MRARLKTIGVNLSYAHVAEIRISAPQVHDGRNDDERIWSARTVTLIGHDGSQYEFAVRSDESVLPVVVEDADGNAS